MARGCVLTNHQGACRISDEAFLRRVMQMTMAKLRSMPNLQHLLSKSNQEALLQVIRDTCTAIRSVFNDNDDISFDDINICFDDALADVLSKKPTSSPGVDGISQLHIDDATVALLQRRIEEEEAICDELRNALLNEA